MIIVIGHKKAESGVVSLLDSENDFSLPAMLNHIFGSSGHDLMHFGRSRLHIIGQNTKQLSKAVKKGAAVSRDMVGSQLEQCDSSKPMADWTVPREGPEK